jgi:CheY-like chemotaxis protein
MSETILIVDDDEVLGQVLQRILSREGYRVVRATGVTQALQLDRDHRPRVGLLDLCLPDGDGVQLADKLRAQHPDLPLILMTAYPLHLRDNPERAERFVRVLTKPLNVSELRRTLAVALTTVSRARSAPVSAAARPAVSPPSEAPAQSFFRAAFVDV